MFNAPNESTTVLPASVFPDDIFPEDSEILIVAVVDPGFEGSHSFSAPSDIDYYGQSASIEDIVSVTLIGADGTESPVEGEALETVCDIVGNSQSMVDLIVCGMKRRAEEDRCDDDRSDYYCR